MLVVDTLDGVFNVPIAALAEIVAAPRLRVQLIGAGQWVDATIRRINPAIDGESGTIQIRLQIDNPDRLYRVGDRCVLQVLHRAEEPLDDHQAQTPVLPLRIADHSVLDRDSLLPPPALRSPPTPMLLRRPAMRIGQQPSIPHEQRTAK